ncbi:MAG: hypothetical protein EPN20_01535 [Magnetospirillum sp.]|nr:MAG: hypothetical protein EPN20_01535 [Magnetospirillum sp.]
MANNEGRKKLGLSNDAAAGFSASLAERLSLRLQALAVGERAEVTKRLVKDEAFCEEVAEACVDLFDIFALEAVHQEGGPDGEFRKLVHRNIVSRINDLIYAASRRAVDRVIEQAEDELQKYAGPKGREIGNNLKNLHNIARLVEAMPTLLPYHLQEMLLNDIENVRVGASPKLFFPTPTGRHRDGKVRRAHLKALEHVAFQRGQGLTQDQAEEKVGREYGVDNETLKQWKRRLSQEYFPSLAAHLVEIRGIGTVMGAMKRAYPSASRQPPQELDRFDRAALERDAKEYRGLAKAGRGAEQEGGQTF